MRTIFGAFLETVIIFRQIIHIVVRSKVFSLMATTLFNSLPRSCISSTTCPNSLTLTCAGTGKLPGLHCVQCRVRGGSHTTWRKGIYFPLPHVTWQSLHGATQICSSEIVSANLNSVVQYGTVQEIRIQPYCQMQVPLPPRSSSLTLYPSSSHSKTTSIHLPNLLPTSCSIPFWPE